METNHAKRLFHAVVVVGAALSPGCGGKVVFEGSGGSGGAGSTATGQGSTSKSTSVGTTSGDPCASTDPSACAPAQYQCELCGGFTMKCTCDTTAPTKPTDCATTADFHCKSYQPPTSCECKPGSPTDPSQCPGPDAFQCSGGLTPPVGCDCVVIIA